MEEKKITLTNRGPIIHAEVAVKPGHVTVLRGRNGVGKSVALRDVERLATGKGDIAETRDGEDSSSVTGLGVSMTIKASTRRKGVAEVTDLSDGLSVADIVDPGMKTPAANDKRRINALLRTVGAEADVALFAAHLEGIDITSVTQARTRRADDLVEMAGAMKKDLDEAAKVSEDAALQLSKSIEARQTVIASGETSFEMSQEDARAAWLQAEQKLAEAKTRHKLASEMQQKADAARAELSAVTDAERELVELIDQMKASLSKIDEQISELQTSKREISDRLGNAAAMQKHIASLEAVVAAATVDDVPTQQDIDALVQEVSEAEQNIQKAVLAENAAKTKEQVAADEEQLQTVKARAAALRKAAKATDTVLSEAVKRVVPWADVADGRLMVMDERRESMITFDELSTGQKWRTALRVAIESAKRLDPDVVLFVLPQDAWQDLDTSNRQIVIDEIAETNVAIVTAEWTDAESLESETL